MSHIKLDTNTFIFPMPVVLVGAVAQGRANFMAVGWVTRINYQPAMVAVGINNKAHTLAGILAHGEFSICHPRADMVEAVDYCGLVSGKRTDKSSLFDVEFRTLAHAPLIRQCPLNLECRLVQDVPLPSNHCLIGEVVAAWCQDDCLTDGSPDIQKLNPLLLTMPDNRYHTVGQPVARAWSAGKALKTKENNA